MDPYIGEVRPVAFNFAPSGWYLCNGQSLPISGHEDLYSLIGTTYGGDGVNTFNLPNLNGRAPIGQGTNPNNVPHKIGQTGGSVMTTLSVANMPPHTHPATLQWTNLPTASGAIAVVNSTGSQTSPIGNVPAQTVIPDRVPIQVATYAAAPSAGASLAGVSVTGSGFNVNLGSYPPLQPQPVQTLPSGLCIAYIMAYAGIYPSQS